MQVYEGKAFPQWVSYLRFVELMPTALDMSVPICVFVTAVFIDLA